VEKLITAVYRCIECSRVFIEIWPDKDKLYPPVSAEALGVLPESPNHPPCPKCGSLYYKRTR